MSRRFELSEKYFERAKKVSPGGVHSPVRGFRGVGGVPVFIESAKGVTLRDVEGQTYTDFCLSWGPLIFGHQDQDIREAVNRAMDRGWSYGTAETYSLELAEELTQNIKGLEKVRFVSSGTEAVMSAVRVARGFTGRNFILKFDGCYHGHVDSLLVRAGSGLAEMASPDSAGISEQTAAETLVCNLDDEPALESIFEKHGAMIAAAIIEPLPANNGLLVQRQEFLQKLSILCKKHGSLLIFDEVISGFRVAFGGMAELTGITPDLMTYGKIIGGGFPVGAYGGRSDVMDCVAPAGPVYQAGTLSANPVAMSAGFAMIKKLLRNQPYNELEQRTTKFVQEWAGLSEKYLPFPTRMQHFGSLFWSVMDRTPSVVRSQDKIPTEQKPRFAKVFHAMLDQGIYLAPSGYEVGFLSTLHNDTILGDVLERAETGFKTLK